MARSASVVEINGNRYDAATGQLIGAVKSAYTSIKPGGGQVLDGFMRRPASASHRTRPASASQSTRAGIKRTAQAVHRRAQRSQTIMRHVVAKPKLKSTPTASTTATRPSWRSAIVTSKRTFRAKTILKSPYINRFSPFSQAPTTTDKNPSQTAAKEGEVLPAPTTAERSSRTESKALAKPLPSMVTSVSHNQLERMLDHALVRADAHKQAVKSRLGHKGPLSKLRRLPRWFSASILLVIFLAAGGFFLWQKVPQLSLKVASSRAHIDATVPSYTPYGFSLAGPIKYDNGAVQTELNTPTDKTKKITVTQQSSNLDSESLAATTIPENVPVQTSQVKGATVYIYGKDNDATWVSKGIKYNIKNDAQLSSDELLKIAAGL